MTPRGRCWRSGSSAHRRGRSTGLQSTPRWRPISPCRANGASTSATWRSAICGVSSVAESLPAGASSPSTVKTSPTRRAGRPCGHGQGAGCARAGRFPRRRSRSAARRHQALLRDMELPLVRGARAQMERTGIAVDTSSTSTDARRRGSAPAGTPTQEADCPRPSSAASSTSVHPSSCRRSSSTSSGCPKTKKIKTGYTTDADALQWLQEQSDPRSICSSHPAPAPRCLPAQERRRLAPADGR